MRLLVCGGRDYDDYAAIHRHLTDMPVEITECPIQHCHQMSMHKPFSFWCDPSGPPKGCSEDSDALHGKPRTITHYTQCPIIIAEAKDQALKRKAAPHCYDQNGNLIPGMANEMWDCLFKFERSAIPPQPK